MFRKLMAAKISALVLVVLVVVFVVFVVRQYEATKNYFNERLIEVQLVDGVEIRDQLAQYAGSGDSPDHLWNFVKEVVELNDLYDARDVWVGRILIVPDRRSLNQRAANIAGLVLE